jgi:cobaltochelatase CobN
LADSSPYRLLKRHLIDGEATTGLPPQMRDAIERASRWYADLGARNEMAALLAALDGRYIPTSYGGDPIKNPDALPTGRNLYGFDPSRIPTQAAWAAGKEAMENLIAAHRKQSGRSPKKLTFSLWSVETMRHQGMLEAQALWGLGVEPVWDVGGRVTDVRLVPREVLKRPRVDIVLSATGLYRDHFPNVMKQLAKAAKLAAEASDVDNPVAANARDIAARLVKAGWRREAAQKAGQTRLFSAESGRYGTGLDDATLATDTWASKAEGDRKLAQLYLSRMQFAYGPDEADWGKSARELSGGKADDTAGNLYSAHLKGTEGAVLSRTSNLYGMLTTDDPFQYLGGIALAVRHLDGKAPELYISNLRGSGSGKVEGAAQFLAKELATRNFHPGYIKGLMAEGYAGTLQVLDSMNNFSGWTMVAREIVRDDQWQEFADVYVRDKHKLGLRDWFERENPHALAQTIERMLEAARHGYWKADAATLEELKQTYRDLAKRFDVRTDNAKFQAFVGTQGYGLASPLPTPPHPSKVESAAPAETSPALPQITGMKLEHVPSEVIQALGALLIASICLLVLFPLVGAWHQWRDANTA